MCAREPFQTTGLATSQRPVILASGDFWGGTTDAVSPCKTADYAFGSNPPYALLMRADRPIRVLRIPHHAQSLRRASTRLPDDCRSGGVTFPALVFVSNELREHLRDAVC